MLMLKYQVSTHVEQWVDLVIEKQQKQHIVWIFHVKKKFQYVLSLSVDNDIEC